MVQVYRKAQADIFEDRGDYHVLTYAEEGFSPLNIHTKGSPLSKDDLVAFASRVNGAFEVGTLFPVAHVSAVPRTLIRDVSDAQSLREHIEAFFRLNATTIKATRLIIDFRTNRVESFAIAATEAAIEGAMLECIDEIAIIQ